MTPLMIMMISHKVNYGIYFQNHRKRVSNPIILIFTPICKYIIIYIYMYTELERLADKYRSKATQSSSMNEKASFDF